MAPAFLVNLRAKLDEKKMRIINFVSYGLIVFTILMRILTAEDVEGRYDHVPSGFFWMQIVWTLIVVAFLVMGEIQKPLNMIAKFPMIISRKGKGVILIATALPLIANNIWAFILCSIIILVGAFNIFIGWGDKIIM